MEKRIKLIYRLTSLICLGSFVVLYMLLFPQNHEQAFCGGCGVVDQAYCIPQREQMPDSIKLAVEEGKILFEANCASCHAIIQ